MMGAQILMGLRERATLAYNNVITGNTPETERLLSDSINLLRQRLRAWQKLMGVVGQEPQFEVLDRVFLIHPRQRTEIEISIYLRIDDVPFIGTYTSVGNQLTICVEGSDESIESLLDLGRVLSAEAPVTS
jgi:hypothetical protein